MADEPVSKTGVRKDMRVQLPPSALNSYPAFLDYLEAGLKLGSVSPNVGADS